MKDYELFRSYYCGLCMAIKKQFGQIPRSVLNYDMTFLAILLDSFNDDKRDFVHTTCIMHPIKKRTKIINNSALDYAAFCNVILAYYKVVDDKEDDNSVKAKIFSKFLHRYVKNIPEKYIPIVDHIKNNLSELSFIEKEDSSQNIDEISHPFADLTGTIISYYFKNKDFSENLYWLGYNLGKWIYIIDARDDLKEDIKDKKYNPLNSSFNQEALDFDGLLKQINLRVEDILLSCGYSCVSNLKDLPLKKNIDLLENILHLGLIEKMNLVFEKK